MKAVLLSTAAAAVAIAAAPALATDITIGNSLASACYRSSFSNIPMRFAIRECDRALEEEMMSDEDRLATIVNRGIVKMTAGDFRGADRDFDTAIALDSKRAEAFLNKGLLRLRQNRLQEAVGYFDQALEAKTIRPALALYARAISQEQLGNLRAAYDDLVRARDLDPDWSLPARELARYRVSER